MTPGEREYARACDAQAEAFLARVAADRRDLIEWEGFGFSWEIHPQASPMRALALDDDWLVGIATARTRAGLIFAMWRTAHRARRRPAHTFATSKGAR